MAHKLERAKDEGRMIRTVQKHSLNIWKRASTLTKGNKCSQEIEPGDT